MSPTALAGARLARCETCGRKRSQTAVLVALLPGMSVGLSKTDGGMINHLRFNVHKCMQANSGQACCVRVKLRHGSRTAFDHLHRTYFPTAKVAERGRAVR